MLTNATDGTPDAVKVACPVWDRGKGGDNIKTLPIVIGRRTVSSGDFLLCVVGGKAFEEKF